MQFDLESVKSKVAESFRQAETEISEQVRGEGMRVARMYRWFINACSPAGC